jgi:hypothetical protein
MKTAFEGLLIVLSLGIVLAGCGSDNGGGSSAGNGGGNGESGGGGFAVKSTVKDSGAPTSRPDPPSNDGVVRIVFPGLP